MKTEILTNNYTINYTNHYTENSTENCPPLMISLSHVYLRKGFCRKVCDWKMLMKACVQISIFKAQPFRRNENLWRCFLGFSSKYQHWLLRVSSNFVCFWLIFIAKYHLINFDLKNFYFAVYQRDTRTTIFILAVLKQNFILVFIAVGYFSDIKHKFGKKRHTILIWCFLIL